MDNSEFSMFFIVHYKIIDFAAEVSQKSTFHELLKNAYLQSSLRNADIASTWPLKKSHWSLLILIISP